MNGEGFVGKTEEVQALQFVPEGQPGLHVYVACVVCLCLCVQRACAAALCVTCIYEHAHVPCICVSLYVCLYACGMFVWPSGLDCIPGVRPILSC